MGKLNSSSDSAFGLAQDFRFASACAFGRAENAEHFPQLISELEIGD